MGHSCNSCSRDFLPSIGEKTFSSASLRSKESNASSLVIRRRRITLSAYELRDTNNRIIDIATKYNFNSADAFTKAFIKQHGITPSDFRLTKGALKIYPPISFHVLIK